MKLFFIILLFLPQISFAMVDIDEIKINNMFQYVSGSASGKILTSDATGNATWETNNHTTDTNAGTLCSAGEYLDGDATCKTFTLPPSSIGDLTDVDTDTVSPSANNFLRFDGSLWKPAVISITESQISDFGTYATQTDLDTVSGSVSSNLSLINTNISDIATVSGSFNLHSLDPNAHHTPTVDTNTNAGTICSAGEFLNGDGTCDTVPTGNATHTGDVSGSTALTIESVAITGQTVVSGSAGDKVLISDLSDSNNLKAVNLSELINPGQGEQSAVQGNRTTTLMPTGTLTAMSFDATDFENNDSVINHDNTNRTRFYLHESGAHIFHFSLIVENTNAQAKTIELRLYKNGVAVPGVSLDFEVGKLAKNSITRFSMINNVTAGDYYEVWTAETGGGNDLTIQAGTRLAIVRLSGEKGNPGPQGADGDITWQGDWVSQNYTVNQAVNYLGSSYVCKLNTVSNEVPTNTTYWDLLASKGDVGPSGAGHLHRYGSNSQDNSSSGSATYEGIELFEFRGTDIETISSASIIANTEDTDLGWVRIYDTTNSQVICETSFNSTPQAVFSMGTISNLPTGPAIFEVQIKRGSDLGSPLVRIYSMRTEF